MYALPARFRHILIDFLLILLFVRSSIPKGLNSHQWSRVSELEFYTAFPDRWYNTLLYYSYAFSHEQHYVFYTITSLTLGLSDLLAKLNLSWTPIASLPAIVSLLGGWALGLAVIVLVISISSKLHSRFFIEPHIASLRNHHVHQSGLPDPSVGRYWGVTSDSRRYFFARTRLIQMTRQVKDYLADNQSEDELSRGLNTQLQELNVSNTRTDNRLVHALSRSVDVIAEYLQALSVPSSQRYLAIHLQLTDAIDQFRGYTSPNLDTTGFDSTPVIEAGYGVLNAFNRYIVMRNTTETPNDEPLGAPNNLFDRVRLKLQAVNERVNDRSFEILNTENPAYPAIGYLRKVVSVLNEYYHSELPANSMNHGVSLRLQSLPTYSQEILDYVVHILDADRNNQQILCDLSARLRDQPQPSVDALENSIVSCWRVMRDVVIPPVGLQSQP